MTLGFLTLLIFVSGFSQKWYIPRGPAFNLDGTIRIADTDHDGYYEVILTPYIGGGYALYFYELHPPNTCLLYTSDAADE